MYEQENLFQSILNDNCLNSTKNPIVWIIKVVSFNSNLLI